MSPRFNNRRRKKKPRFVFDKEAWQPKTKIGKLVKSGAVSSLEELFLSGHKIMEPEIVDFFIDDLSTKVIDVRKTTRVTRAGRNFSFRITTIVGDKNGHVGVGTGKNIERFVAQEKALQNAKLHLVKVKRGCGSWECNCSKNHSVPFKTIGKCASLRVELLPAPNGVGLAVSDTIKPVLELAGISDVWSKTRGATDTKLNFVRATIDALMNLSKLKYREKIIEVNDNKDVKQEDKNNQEDVSENKE